MKQNLSSIKYWTKAENSWYFTAWQKKTSMFVDEQEGETEQK